MSESDDYIEIVLLNFKRFIKWSNNKIKINSETGVLTPLKNNNSLGEISYQILGSLNLGSNFEFAAASRPTSL